MNDATLLKKMREMLREELAAKEIPELFTPTEAAEALRTTYGSMANMRHRGEGPPYLKVAGKIRYEKKALAEYIANC